MISWCQLCRLACGATTTPTPASAAISTTHPALPDSGIQSEPNTRASAFNIVEYDKDVM
jgi:hypothetical protein